MRKFDRFQDAAKLEVVFDSMSDRKLYLKVGKYSVIVGFESVLNDKVSVKYARYTFDCSCAHAAMRTEQMQNTCNLCKHCLAAIAWLVNNKGRWEKCK